MYGLRIEPSRWNAVPIWPATPEMNARHDLARRKIPNDCSSFWFFFEPIFPDLASCWLYWGDECPLSGWEDAPDVADAVGILPVEDYFPPNAILPRFANYVIEDWADLFFFKQPPCPYREFVRRRDDDRFLKRVVDLAFHNVDGAFWVFFARDETFVRRIRERIESLGDPFTATDFRWEQWRKLGS